MPMGQKPVTVVDRHGNSSTTYISDWYSKSRRPRGNTPTKTLSDSRFRRGPQGRRNQSQAPTLMQALMMGGFLR
mgnify:CR=1 FL=1